jgi:hypothetical protein
MTRIGNELTLKLSLSVIVLAVGASAARAAPVGPLTTFTAGTPAKASDVNGNFTTIVNTVNANDARLTTVETNKQNVVTGSCPAGSAIRSVAANGSVTCQSTGGNVGFTSVSSAAGVPIADNVAPPSNIQTSLCVIFCNAFGRFQSSPGSSFLAVPIQLPHGATITAFSYSCFCNAAVGSSALFFRDDNFIVTASITTLANTIQTVTITDFSGAPAGTTVVDGHFSYVVLMSIDGTAQGNIIPVRATVTYTMP